MPLRKPPEVTAFFQRLGDAFLAGRLQELAGAHLFPCPVEERARMVVLPDAEAYAAYFGAVRAALLARGVVAVAPRIVAIEIPRRERFRVWVRWARRFADRAEEEDDDGSVYYLVIQPDGRLAVEMMAFVQSRLPGRGRRVLSPARPAARAPSPFKEPP